MWQFILTLIVTAGGKVIHKVAEEIVELQKNQEDWALEGSERRPRSSPDRLHLWAPRPCCPGTGRRWSAPGGGPVPHPTAP